MLDARRRGAKGSEEEDGGEGGSEEEDGGEGERAARSACTVPHHHTVSSTTSNAVVVVHGARHSVFSWPSLPVGDDAFFAAAHFARVRRHHLRVAICELLRCLSAAVSANANTFAAR